MLDSRYRVRFVLGESKRKDLSAEISSLSLGKA